MLDDFKATVGKRGFARPTLFRVEFTKIPNSLNNIRGINEILKDLHFYSETAEVPGTQVLTQDLRYYDLISKYAYGKTHDDLNITFRVDRDYQVKKLFDSWINSIYDRETGNVGYKADYTGTVQIYQVMENGYSSYAVEMDEIFPIQLAQISLGWDQAGAVIRLPVTFAFNRMRTIVNKTIFEKPFANNRDSNVLTNEQTILGNLDEKKSSLTSLLDDNLGAFRQVTVMNSTDLGSLNSGFDFI